MKQQERQERSRREIFQAAMEEFGSHGYDQGDHGAHLYGPTASPRA